MYSNPAIVMFTRSKLIATVKILVGVQLIALGIAASVEPLVSFSHSHLYSSAGMSQEYQPPNTIGGPKSSLGSGTR